MASNPAPCGGGTDEVGAVGDGVGTAEAGAGEEVGIAGGTTGGGAEREVGGGGDNDEAGWADGAGDNAVFIPRRLPPRPFPPLLRHPEL
jgi:hypothetical protein